MYIDKTQTPDDGQLCLCKVPGFNATGLAIAVFRDLSFIMVDFPKVEENKSENKTNKKGLVKIETIVLDHYVTEYMKLNADGSINLECIAKEYIQNEPSESRDLNYDFNLSITRKLNDLEGLSIKRFHYIAMENIEGPFYTFLNEEITFEQFKETFSNDFIPEEDFEILQHNFDLLDELQADHINGFFCTVSLPTVRQFLPNGELVIDDISDEKTIEKHIYQDSIESMVSAIEYAYTEHIESQRPS